MPAAIRLREDYTAREVRGLAAKSKDAWQCRRLLAIAAVYDGMSREAAAKVGGMDRQTLRDWVHRFNAHGPDGLFNERPKGAKCRLTASQLDELAEIVLAGPDPARDGVVRWRCIDLADVIRSRFGVTYHERSVGKILKRLGFCHVSPRPRSPGQDARVIEAFKKTSPIGSTTS